MPYEQGPSQPGARLEDADFSHTRLHAPNFEGARITDGWFLNADISGDIEGLRLNGVEVAPLVLRELERLQPERVLLRATEPDKLAEAWEMIEDLWQTATLRAERLTASMLNERIDDDWSFIETLRHLVLATDCWLRRMVKGMDRPFHPVGLSGSWLADPTTWGLHPDVTPTLTEMLDIRRARMDEVRHTIETSTDAELARVCVPPPPPGHPTTAHTVLQCLHVILTEEWEHHQYAMRDLEVLEARG